MRMLNRQGLANSLACPRPHACLHVTSQFTAAAPRRLVEQHSAKHTLLPLGRLAIALSTP